MRRILRLHHSRHRRARQVNIASSALAAAVRPSEPPPRVASLAAVLSAAPPSDADNATVRRALSELRKIASGSAGAWMHTGEMAAAVPTRRSRFTIPPDDTPDGIPGDAPRVRAFHLLLASCDPMHLPPAGSA